MPGAPVPLMEQALRDACIRICERTNLIQVVESQTAAAGVQEFNGPGGTQQILARILRVSFGIQVLMPISVDSVRHGAALGAADRRLPVPQIGTPSSYYAASPGTDSFYLHPVPDKAGVLVIRAALRPTADATSVEDVLYDRWHSTVATGALAQLMAMPNQGFTNDKKAADAEAQFHAALSRASSEGRRGHLRGSGAVQLRLFG